jgi:hypothetical protein
MSVTQEEIDRFHEFATNRAKSGGIDSFDELYLEWNSHRERAAINAEISRGLADVDAGRYEPAKVATQEIARDLGLTES